MITAKKFLGESTLTIGFTTYGLRPSFAALYAIEQHTGHTIPHLLAQMSQQPHPAFIRITLVEGIKAFEGNPAPHYCLTRWQRMKRKAIAFLLQGLGYPYDEAMLPTDRPSSAHSVDLLEPLDWPVLYRVATVALGKTEDEFWAMTMQGFLLQMEHYAHMKGDEILSQPPLTHEELSGIMMRWG